MDNDLRELTSLIAQGDYAAFKVLFDLYHQKMIHFAVYFLKSKEWAEEAVADVFYQVWKRRDNLDSIGDIKSYLYICVKNQSLHYLRRAVPMVKEPVDIYEVEWLVDGNNPEANLLDQEYHDLIQKAINSLPLKCREVFRLVFADRLKHKDIALLLDISEKTVEGHITKAYKRISEYVNKEYHDTARMAAVFSIFL